MPMITLDAGETYFELVQGVQAGSTIDLNAISRSAIFSFNLIAQGDIVYQFNSPLGHIKHGRTFNLMVLVEEGTITAFLDGMQTDIGRFAISPHDIDGIRIDCSEGGLNVKSLRFVESISDLLEEPDGEESEIDSETVSETDSDPRLEQREANLQITQFTRPAWKPIVEDGDSDLLASKFSGRPWLSPSESWPLCPCCARPLQFFLQLNLDTLPDAVRGEFGAGILQLFYCIFSLDCDRQLRRERATIGYGRRPYLDRALMLRLVQPTDRQPTDIGSAAPLPEISRNDDEMPFTAKTITGWQTVEDYPDFHDLVVQVYGWERADDWDDNFLDEVVDRLGLEHLGDYEDHSPTVQGDKLSGYPNWSQDMEYPGCPICQAPMRLVFQLASWDNLPYQFGDMGTAHILQCKTHRERLAFVWACS